MSRLTTESLPVFAQTVGCLPSVSVLLPAWNEATMIGRCLDSLTGIDWPGLEIVVCAGGGDGTLEIARSYQNRRVVVLQQRPGEGKQVALRRCLAESRGEIIYLTDADCTVPASTFFAVLDPIIGGHEHVVTGNSRSLPDFRHHPIVRYQDFVSSVGAGRLGDYSVGLHGRNTALTRSALTHAGGFAWSALTGTDYALAEELHRHGFRIRHVPVEVFSEYPMTIRGYIRQQSRWLRNLVLLGVRYRRWSLALPAIVSSVALSVLAVASASSAVCRYPPRSVIGLAWSGLVAKRALNAWRRGDRRHRRSVVSWSVLMTPVEVWIRLQVLVELAQPGCRWRW